MRPGQDRCVSDRSRSQEPVSRLVVVGGDDPCEVAGEVEPVQGFEGAVAVLVQQ